MSIYKRPVPLLFRDFILELNPQKGEIIKRDHFFRWFEENHPDIKSETISVHFLIMSTNAPDRVNFDIDPAGRDDLLYQIDDQNFRLYNSTKDPAPIRKASPSGGGKLSSESESRDVDADKDAFMEPGLKIYR